MKEIGRLLRAYCHDTQKSWRKRLQDIEECLNMVPHERTGYPPCQVVTGEFPHSAVTENLENFSERPKQSLDEIRKSVRRRYAEASELVFKGPNETHQFFRVGSKVLLRSNYLAAEVEGAPKLSRLFEGPFEIISLPYPNTCRLVETASRAVKGVYNWNNLRPYFSLE